MSMLFKLDNKSVNTPYEQIDLYARNIWLTWEGPKFNEIVLDVDIDVYCKVRNELGARVQFHSDIPGNLRINLGYTVVILNPVK